MSCPARNETALSGSDCDPHIDIDPGQTDIFSWIRRSASVQVGGFILVKLG